MSNPYEDEARRRPKSRNLRPLLRLTPFLRPYRRQMVFALIALLAAAGATLAVPVAVRTTLASAAGDANTIVAPIRRHASSSAAAVSVAGAVTSMSARPVTIPSAGPKTANGAKAATNRSAGVIP